MLLTALISAPLANAQQPPTEPSKAEAIESLEAAEAALAPDPQAVSAEPLAAAEQADATLALNQLAASYLELERADRRRARGLLARPTDGAADQYGDGYPAGAPVVSAESPHFCVHWVNEASREDAPDLTDANAIADGDGVPDFVEAILEIAEYSYSIEVAPGALGWEPPKQDAAGCGADPAAHADIYLKQLGLDGIFGYESPDPDQGVIRSQHGYIVIDDDFTFAEYGYPDPLDPARVTLAHEFNHLLQQNYDSFQEPWMFESTATWAENQVYPTIDDYLFYVGAFASRPGKPITDPNAAGLLRIYGAAVWNHWLDSGGGGYGVKVIRSAWQRSDRAKPPDNAIAAYDLAIRRAGGPGFSREFVRFAAATSEWRTGFGRFVDSDRYADVARKGSLASGERRRASLDHAAYRLVDVEAGSGPPIRLSVEVERGVRSGIALVARRGGEGSATVTAKRKYLANGGRSTVTLTSPRDYERITAVLINADGRVSGFDPANGWVYGRDDASFRFELSRRADPGPRAGR